MDRPDQQLTELIDTLQCACGELGPGLGTLSATALVIRAVVGLLDERGLLATAEVRDCASELADAAGMKIPEARAAVERMLPESLPVAVRVQ